MTRNQAIKRVQKLYNGKGCWSVNQQLSSPERRQAAIVRCDELKAQLEATDAQIRAWLEAQPEYQALLARKREQRTELDAVRWQTHYYKFSVGKDLGWAREITGSGDTWEEAIAAAEAKKR